METDIIELKPEAIIIGQGLWYPREYPNSSYYELYRNDLRENMKDMTSLKRKVFLNYS